MSGAVKATNNGTYPNVFLNANVDGSFGVTSPIILRQYSLSRDYRSAHLDNILSTLGSKNGFQYGYSVTQYGSPPYSADKSGKDDNFRGERIFHDTLYVSKGSGGNGIDTVFQVGAIGMLRPWRQRHPRRLRSCRASRPVSRRTFSPIPARPLIHPFGLWFTNATTLYVADEGDGVNNKLNALNPNAGLQKWSLTAGTWHLDYTLQNGLSACRIASPAWIRASTPPWTGYGTVTISPSPRRSALRETRAPIPIGWSRLPTTLRPRACQTNSSIFWTAGFGEVLRGVAFTPCGDEEDFRCSDRP